VILQASQGAIKYAGLDSIVAMVKVMAEKVSVSVALHLDHGTDYYQNIKCLRAGFTSLMYDGSKLPFDENGFGKSKREHGCSGGSCKIC
jgi:fructose-bisphosphate aldolase class II